MGPSERGGDASSVAGPGGAPARVGRYVLWPAFAQGGAATVHLGRLVGPGGFGRTVAIKRLHGHLARDPGVAASLLEEARIAARIRHPNVVPTLDVVADGDELCVVMEYVEGETLARLLRAAARSGAHAPPPAVAVAIVADLLRGLHAAHEARDEQGRPLGVVHRDVSPQNCLVGVDGVARVLDFGIAKAIGRAETTHTGQIKGKPAYMPPEQIRNAALVRRETDVYAAAVVAWEALTGSRLFASDEASMMARLEGAPIAPPSGVEPALPPALDAVVLRGLAADPRDRYATAVELARALEAVVPPAPAADVAAWVRATGGAAIDQRAAWLAALEARAAAEPTGAGGEPPRAAGPGFAAVPAPPTAGDADRAVADRTPDPAAIDATPRPARRATWLAALAAGLALAAFLLGRATSREGAPAPAPEARADAPAAPAVSTAPPASASAAPASASASPPASASVAPPGPPPSAAAAPTARPSRPPAAAPTARPRPAAPCDPPHYIDADGVKRYRPECLR